MIALLAITDGRDDCLQASIASANESLRGAITERWMYDDTGDEGYRARLARRYPEWTHVNGGPRLGFGGAIASTWRRLAARSAARFVFHLEADFTFDRPVDLDELAAVLDARPYLVQLALRRQAWNADERAAGGVIERHPMAYTEIRDDAGRAWLEHRLFFTTNPSLYRRTLCRLPWPTGPHSEGRFTLNVVDSGLPGVPAEAVRFGYWGARDSAPAVTHIGHERKGVGY